MEQIINTNTLEEFKAQFITKMEQILNEYQPKTSEWLSLKEGASYAGVSYNTFIKFRVRGLKVCEIEGVKRVSKSEIDRFLNDNSF